MKEAKTAQLFYASRPHLSSEMDMIENNHGLYIRNEVASIFPNKKIYFMTDYYDPKSGPNRNPIRLLDFNTAFTDDFLEIKWMNVDHLLEVRNKQAFLVYEMFLETGESFVKYLYLKCIKRDIPPEQIIIVGSSIDFQELSEKYAKMFKCNPMINIYYAFFERNTKRRFLLDSIADENLDRNTSLDNLESKVSSDIKLTDPLVFNQFNKRFIFLNNLPRIHRFCLLSLLESCDLIKEGYVSFLGNYVDTTRLQYEIKLLFSQGEKYTQFLKGTNIRQKLPLYLDDLSHIRTEQKLDRDRMRFTIGNVANLSLNSLYNYVNHSFINIVAETFFIKDKKLSSENIETRFLTEKTFKSIAFRQPFIIASLPRTLEMLRSLGYKTFNPIIDESYDLIEDDGERLYKIFLEIKRLCEIDEKTLEEYRIKLIPIIEHNFNLLMNRKDHFHLLRPASKSAI